MVALSKATLTNLDAGPRGLETAGGLLMLAPGAEVSVELADADLAAATHSGWFAVTRIDAAPPAKKRAR